MTTPPTDPSTPETLRSRRATRRQLFVATASVFGAAAAVRALGGGLTGGGGLLDASGNPLLSGAAEAESPAERLGPPPPPEVEPTSIVVPPDGKVAFPIDPSERCHVLDNYGDCRGGGSRAHVGVDIMDERGRTVYAVADGRLTTQYTNATRIGAGLGWTLKADDGRYFRYFHLDEFAEDLEEGDEVEFGQVIGYLGATGTDDLENNNHLHFEFYPSGPLRVANSVDPLDRLDLPDDISVGPRLGGCAGLIPSV